MPRYVHHFGVIKKLKIEQLNTYVKAVTLYLSVILVDFNCILITGFIKLGC